MNKRSKSFLAAMCLLLIAGVLAMTGCGSGSGSSSPAASTLSGTAAVGSPIVGGTITVSCAAGSALSTTTSSTGDWQVTVSGQTPPCAVQVSGGTINGTLNTTSYHSIASALGTVNVTPLTDLIVSNLAGAATPGTWFGGLNSTALSAINQTQIDAALTQLRTALALTPLNTIDPITTTFTATSGNSTDDMLAALNAAMTGASVTYANLLSNASATTFTLPAGLGSALTAAYANTTSGGNGGGTGGGSGGGSSSATINVTAATPSDGNGAIAVDTITEASAGNPSKPNLRRIRVDGHIGSAIVAVQIYYDSTTGVVDNMGYYWGPDGVTLTNFTFCSDGSTTPCTGASVNLASNTAAFNVDLNNVNGFDVLVATTMAHLSGDVSF